jgi:HTH-type transcriptional regulator / antitoxin HigA
MNESDKYKEIDSLLGQLVKQPTLKELFDNRVAELKMPPTTALKVLGFGYTPLKRLLEGSESTVDIVKLFKLADFLQLPKEQIVKMYAESLERSHYTISDITSPDKVKFIKENFDLAGLRKAGFINNISDFANVESRIIQRLGLKSIFEYRKPAGDVAFSSAAFNPDHHQTRSIWLRQAMTCFEEINNPYPYHRAELIKIFPQIRWYSTDAETGMLRIVRALFRLGITVIFLPKLENLKVKGATLVINDKPCVVLTNWYDLYPSLWFTLLHELYHVLFDLEDIGISKYHVTDDSNDQASVRQREALADNFSREYLLPNEKLNMIRSSLSDKAIVDHFAQQNHVHSSIVYAFHAFDRGKLDRKAWARTRQNSPPLSQSIVDISFLWDDPRSIEEITKERKQKTYN